MWWLIAVVIIIAAFAFPRFGKAFLVLAVLLVAGILIVVAKSRWEQQASRNRMPIQEVELSELKLASEYGGYTVVGRVRNRSSRYTLKSFDMRVTVRDCPEQGACETVGESEESVYVTVPPGQSRGVSESVYFSNLPKFRGRFEWSYTLIGVSAE